MTAPRQGSSTAFLDFVRSREFPLASMRSTGPSNTDVAKFILARAQKNSMGPGSLAPDKDDGQPSIMGRIFDVLSRPNYAVANFVDAIIDDDPETDPFGEAWEGITGRDKTTFSNVLETAGMEEGFGRSALGLGLDIFADPLTYVGGAGIAKAIGKGAGKTKVGQFGKAVAQPGTKPLQEQILARGEPVFPEAFGMAARPAQQLPVGLKVAPKGKPRFTPRPTGAGIVFRPGEQLQMPGIAVPGRAATKQLPVGPKVSVPKATDQAQYSLKFGKGFGLEKLKISPTGLVDQAAKGMPDAIAKMAPKPLPTPKMSTAKIQAQADEILSKFDPSKATAKLNKTAPETINAKQQRFLWEKARQAVQAKTMRKGRSQASVDAEILANTSAVYKAMENALIQGGKVPRIGTGENVKLSDVIAEMIARDHPIDNKALTEFASEIKPGSNVDDVVQSLRARGAIDESLSVKNIVDKAVESKTLIQNSKMLSDNKMKDFEGFVKKVSESAAKASGLSPAAVKATGGLLDTAIKAGKTAAQVTTEMKRSMLDYTIRTGKNNPVVNEAMVRSLSKDLGELPRWVHNDNKVVEWVMSRMATWWGQRDLRPMTLNMMGSGYSMARARGQVLDNMFQGFNAVQKADAFRAAQGLGKATDDTQELASQISRFMDNTLGHARGQSVLFRSGVTMDRLNAWTTRHHVKHEFAGGKTKHPMTGQDIDLGDEWWESWKYWDIGKQDPKKFLFDLQEGMSQATVERAMFDDLAARFGSRFPNKEFRTKIDAKDFPYLDGYHFPDEIAKQIPRAIKDWVKTPWGPSSEYGKFLDRLQSMWKSAVTIYRPGHHVRNMAGDSYLGWMDGVNTVRPYILAARVQRAVGNYTDIADVDRLIEVGLMKKSMGTPKPGEILFKNKSGVPFTAEQIKYVADQKGLLEHAKTLEDIIDLGQGGAKILNRQPFGGRVQKKARQASELQSHNARLAHFIDKVMKSKGSNLEEIFEQASRRARKWHPTGLDLTFEEKKYARRLIPFYSWMRKSLPLLMEGLARNPGKTVIPAKIYDAIQESQGIETPGRHDPFPVDQMFPSWIRDQGVGPIDTSNGGFLSAISNQTLPGYVMGGMGLNPLTDLIAQVSSPDRHLLSSLTPGLKIPIEHLTGREAFTQAPITGPEADPGAYEEYIGKNIPFYSVFQQFTGQTPFGGETKRAMRGEQSGKEAFYNWLTGTGVKGTGPYIRSARYEETQKQRRAGEDFFRAMRGASGGS